MVNRNPSSKINNNQKNIQSEKLILKSDKKYFQTFLIGLILWLASLILFINFPVTQITDGRFMLLLSHAVAFDKTTRLDPYFQNHQDLKPRPNFFYWWWQLSPKKNDKIIHSHNANWDGKDPLYYRYPNLPSFLSIPVVVALNKLLDIKIVRDGNFSFPDENLAHKIFAAILCAFIIVEVFFLAKIILPTTWAVILTIATGYGTQIVSTLSRGVWSDTWAVLISLLAIYHLLAHAIGKSRLQPIYLAIISTLAFFCKPNYAVIGIISVIYVGLNAIYSEDPKKKQILYWLIGGGLIGILIFFGYSIYQFGTFIPDYYIPAMQIKYIPEAILGHTFSPSRGLFIYSSYLLMIIYFLFRYRKVCVAKILVKSSLLPILIIVFISCAWQTWWGGHSYGPRLIIPLLPFTILLSLIACNAFYNFQKQNNYKNIKTRIKIENGLLIITCLASMLINIHGAREPKTWFEWFYKPYPVFNNPNKRIWDWSDPQFLAGIKKRSFEK